MTEPLRAFESGFVDAADGNKIYWEASGNPDGKAALYLHGGPGAGLGAGGYRHRYDPHAYRVVGIDQRGCGRSRPLATDALDTLANNTTQALVADIETVRRRLGIERWLVSGVSWGTTLALAYALAHPQRVSQLVLVALTTTSREEVDWITDHMGRVFPEAWHRLEAASDRRGNERVVEAYARRLATGDSDDRLRAAQSWVEWESTHISLDPNFAPFDGKLSEEQRLVFATLVTHYWSNDGFLHDGNGLLDRAASLGRIPAVLIHGRRDISGPAITAWRLHKAWPASRLVIVEHEGHGGPECMAQMRIALDGFATTP